jgi:hypothetical protein
MEIKLESAKLVDGVTVVEYEKLEPGFPVFVVDAEGNKVPAPAGYHTLEDGITKIEVDEAGLIMEVSNEAEAADEEASEEAPAVVEVSGTAEEAAAEPTLDVAMEDTIVERIAERVEEKMKMIFEAVEEVAKEVSTIKEEMGAMKTKMEKFSKAPAANKIPTVSMPKVTDAIDSFDMKLEILKNAMKK